MRASTVLVLGTGFACVAAAILASTDSLEAGASGVRSFSLPAHGAVTLAVPANWRETVKQPPGALPPTIEFAPQSGDDFSVLLTPLWQPDPNAEPHSLEKVRQFVEEVGKKTLKHAVEKDLSIVPIEGPELSGFMFSVTDSAVKEGAAEAGDYRYMTQGTGLLADLMVTFTILTHRSDDPAREQALEMLRSARRIAAAEVPQPPAGASLRKITYPGKPWSLVLDLPGFEFSKRETRPDGTGIMVMGSNKETGLIISVFLEKAAKAGDAVACREFYWKKAKKSPFTKKDLRLSERNDMALVEYLVPEFQGIKADQKNVNAYMSRDGVWVDIHISKMRFTPADWSLFEAILTSARFAE